MKFKVIIKLFRFFGRLPSKTFLAMKLTCVLLLFGCLQVSARGYSQNVSLSVKGASLEHVFKLIEQQTAYSFYYKVETLKNTSKVNISVTNMPLEQALNEVFKNEPLTFKIIDKNIVITKKPAEKRVLATIIEELPAILKGRVVDENGKPIQGASVLVKGTTKATATNKNGEFTFSDVDDNRTLIISNIGYTTVEIKIKGRTSLTIALHITSKEAQAVVINTGIFNKADKSFTGASATYTTKQLQEFGNRNLITSLRNIDPSFNIVESNIFGSDPNKLPEVQIRGNSSIPNINQLQDQTRVGLNTPLIILDGFESTLQKMLDINPSDVASVTILKDASATSIYGSRGSNGVVVITTKPPIPGKLRLSYRSDFSYEAPDLSSYHLLDARNKLDLEFKAGYYTYGTAGGDIPLKQYYNYLLNQINSGVNTDWMALPLRNGFGQRHNVRIEGGDQSFRYAATAQINNIAGVMKGSNRNTFNGSIDLSYNYKNLRFINYLTISQGKSTNSPYGSFGDYVRMNPYWHPYDDNGNVLKLMGDPGNLDYTNRWRSRLPTSPLYNATLNDFDKTNRTGIVNNTSIEWRMHNGITARARFGITKNIDQTDVYRSADNTAFTNYSDNDIFRKGDYNYGISNGLSYDGSLNLSYSRTFAQKHTLFAGLDYNIRQDKNSTYGFLAEGFTNPNADFLSMALQYEKGGKPSGSESFNRSVGFTGNVNYIYDNRYFVDASYRVDGSSQFGSNKRFAPFWSTGLGWNLQNEAFLAGSKVINRLKIRGSIGITGSQNFSSYQALSTYEYYTDSRYFNWNGARMMALGNPDLQWQQAMKYDVGVDAEMFEQRVKLTADYYVETTNDLVSSVNLPASNGFPSYVDNIGKLRNKGYEIKATVYVIRNLQKNLYWSVTGAAIHNQNEVLETSQALKDAQKSIQNSTGAPGFQYVGGYSSNTIWVVKSLGIDPSTGKELYLTQNGKPTYTWSGNDVVAAGNTDPKLFGNLSTMVRYKSLSLNVSFSYRVGGELYNSTLVNRVETGDYNYNVDQRVYDDRWQKPGDKAAFKGLLVTTPTYKTSRFVQDENTLNCRNIRLEYDLRSPNLKNKYGLENLTIGAGIDDPFYVSTINRERGLNYPFSRLISFTVSATF